ncbi:MAG TPA: N-acetylgalactosamine-6-sulfatase [Bacteroidales bacterium]|nr:N-acetylgalactosamine-6-sulfatase [Bacteroidales bacterium]
MQNPEDHLKTIKQMQTIRLAAKAVAGITSAILLLPSCAVEKEKLKPNIIVFLADDLGYGDLACYNDKGFHTPAVESIANQGVRFTEFYSNGAESTPTRTALLTGRYQQRVGGLECAIGTGNVGRYDDAIKLRETNDLGLPVSETSIAQLLKRAGYNTAICGKWHLGYEDKFSPNLHGFDYVFYALGGGMDYFHHRENTGPEYLDVLIINGKPVTMPGYFTDLIGNEALNFIDKQDGKTPFFLYVPFTAPHAPYQGPEDYLSEPLPDTSYLWNQSKGPKHTYQAMIRSMDENIGKILDKLEEKQITGNTLIVFMSDNGGTTSGDNGPLRGFKGNLFEGGIRVPCVVKWPGKIASGIVSDQPCMTMDISASIARVAGASIPENRKFDGIDILKYIEKDQPAGERTLFWRARRGEQTRKAVRKGEMKYIRLDNAGKIEEYLFDLGSDLSETANLLSSFPDVVIRMRELIDDWEKEVEPTR